MAEDETKPFECEHCGKGFGLPSYRTRHVKRVHKKTDIVRKPKFMCSFCDKEFSYKHTLRRHLETVHCPDKRFTCDKCNCSFTRKDELTRHIRKSHTEKRSKIVKKFNCAHCTRSFSTKGSLRRHKIINHQFKKLPRRTGSRKCPLCDFCSSERSKQEINTHFENMHNLNMDWTKLKFQNMEEFINWKNLLEFESNASFIKASFSTVTSWHYLCHRGGKFKPLGANKRRLKMMGSCKINAHCPCEIIAKIDKNSEISVSYLPTHVGHEKDLKFLHLRPEDKKSLAAKLLSKSSHSDILKAVRTSVFNNEMKRIHLTNKKDLFNIAKSHNMKNPCTCIDDSTISNMCKHIHTVARSVEPREKTTTVHDDDFQLEIVDNEETVVCKSTVPQVIEIVETREEKKQKIMHLLKVILEVANTEQQLDLVNTSLKEMEETVRAMAPTT